MRSLIINFRIDDGSGGFASPSITFDRTIVSEYVVLKRVSITTRDYSSSDYHRIIGIKLPFLNLITNTGSYSKLNTIAVTLPKDDAVSYVCNEMYPVVGKKISDFNVTLFDYNGANSSNVPNHCYISLTFEIDDVGAL